MNISIHARLLTYAYFGSIKPIESGIFTETLHLPSIYTLAGSFLTRLIELGSDPNTLIEDIKKDKLIIKGIYIYHKGRYYVQITPNIVDNNFRLRLPLHNDNFKMNKEGYGTSPLHRLITPIPRFKTLDKEDMKKRYFVEINNIKEGAKVENNIMNFKSQERVRTALDYNKKVPAEDKLFSLSMLSINDELQFCIDIKSDDQLINNLTNWVGHFGGEGSIAEFSIKHESHLFNEDKKAEVYLAVSHIPIKYYNGMLVTPFGKVEYIIGKITQLGGWDLNNNFMKKIYACIEPGSIFKVSSNDEIHKVFGNEEWYIKLLSSIIQLS